MPLLLGIGLYETGKRLTKVKMAVKLYTNEAWLRKRFHVDKKTPEQIAKECGTSVETIYVYLAKFGLRKSKR
jgi:anaerobic selenocysteine-containing dehydrogenase